MKQLLSNYFLLIVVLLSGNCFAQGVSNNPSAIASFYVHIDPTLGPELGLSDKEIANINMRNNHYENSVLIMDSTFNLLYYRVNNETNLELLPLETLASSVRCTRLGYPFSTLKKAAKRAEEKQYVTIEVSVEPGTTETLNDSNGLNNRIDQDMVVETRHMVVSPNIRIDMEFADALGNKVATFAGTYSGNQRIQLGNAKFTTDIYIPKIESPIEENTYFTFLNLAMDRLISQVNAIVN